MIVPLVDAHIINSSDGRRLDCGLKHLAVAVANQKLRELTEFSLLAAGKQADLPRTLWFTETGSLILGGVERRILVEVPTALPRGSHTMIST